MRVFNKTVLLGQQRCQMGKRVPAGVPIPNITLCAWIIYQLCELNVGTLKHAWSHTWNWNCQALRWKLVRCKEKVAKGSFTYYVIKEGEGGFQMITLDYEGEGGFAQWLRNQKYSYFSQIFTKFWANFVSDFQNVLRIRLHKLGHIIINFFIKLWPKFCQFVHYDYQ